MDTTIQVSKELLNQLSKMKMHSKESYETILWDLIEDRLQFSEETQKNIEDYEYQKDKETLKLISFEKVKQKMSKK